MPTLTKTSNTTLTQLLDLYPRFLDTSPDSVHYRYHQVLGSALHELRRNIKIVKLSSNLRRPLKIWKEQKEPQKYTIHYQVELEGIQCVKLYQENRTEPLKDSGILKTDTNNYQDSYTAQSEEIIPSIRYYLEVETYEGFTFQKGFPENPTIQDDIYDHDKAIDHIGQLHGIKRHQYTKTSPEKYKDTYPPFNNSQTEWDACYEKRIQKYLENYHQKSLPLLEFETKYHLQAIIQCHSIYLGHMNESKMDSKNSTIATNTLNPNVYHLNLNLNQIPTNINPPNLKDIETLVRWTFPLSSKINITYPSPKIEGYEITTEKSGIDEEIISKVLFEFEEEPTISYIESQRIEWAYMDKSLMDANTSILAPQRLEDSIECQKMQTVNLKTITETIQKTPPIIASSPISTVKNKVTYLIDFKEGERKGTKIVEGHLTPDNSVYESIRKAKQIQEEKHSYSHDFTQESWVNLADMYKDGTLWTFGYTEQTAWLQGYEFNHEIPLEAKIVNITMRLERNSIIGSYSYDCKLIVPDPCQQSLQTHLKEKIQKTSYGDNDNEYFNIEETWTIPTIKPAQINNPQFTAGFKAYQTEKSNIITCRNLETIIQWRWDTKYCKINLPSHPKTGHYETINIHAATSPMNTVKYSIVYGKDSLEGELKNGENKISLSEKTVENPTLILYFPNHPNTAQIEKIEYTINTD